MSAAQYQRAMLNQVKSRGGTVFAPFAVPDKAHPGRYTCYASFHDIYPNLELGDIWLSRVFLSRTGVVNMMYRHTIRGTDRAAITTDVRQRMAMNLKSHGTALGSLALPAEPVRLPGNSP